MWALVENNQVTQVYTRPKAITIGDVNYPQNIFMLWSSDELEAIGIYEVVVDVPFGTPAALKLQARMPGL